MVRIYNRDTGEIHELQLISWETHEDYLKEVLVSCNQSDDWYVGIPDNVEVDFAMSDKEVDDWSLWTKNEQRINDIYEKADEETQDLITLTYSDADWDLWLPQQRVFDVLGLDWNETVNE